jgi:hypothetical protein
MLLNQIHKGVVSMEYNNYLYHHGILGQKWGVRRSLQQLGYRISSGFHKNSGDSKSGSGKGKGSSAKGSSSNTAKPQDPNKVKVLVDGKIKVKSLDKMTNQELMDQVNRISNINKIREMNGENYSRSEAALVTTMAEMVVSGVSTRKVARVVETLCGTSISKSAVSDVCKDLDQEVEAFRNRPIEGNYPFLTVDATYFKVRENGRVVSKALMIAYGTNDDGRREILGFSAYRNESRETWKDFLTGLKKRGLCGLMMITSDAHDGIINAAREVFPDVPWQRCQFHFSKN